MHTIHAKTILNPSRVPMMDYTINPYTGCAYGCTYCYAAFSGRYLGKTPDQWGTFVFAKANLPHVLERELLRLPFRKRSIFISSVTDAYQGIEGKLELTRSALELLVRCRYRGRVQVLTKSPLVLRDVDLLTKLNHDVGITLTAGDDALSRALEPRAPRMADRLQTLRELCELGLRAYAFVGPVFPHLTETPEVIDELFRAISETGVTEIYVSHLNMRSASRSRIMLQHAERHKLLMDRYYRRSSPRTKSTLASLVSSAVVKHELKMRVACMIDH